MTLLKKATFSNFRKRTELWDVVYLLGLIQAFIFVSGVVLIMRIIKVSGTGRDCHLVVKLGNFESGLI